MKAYSRFFENLQQDLKAFLFWCLLLTFFRIIFIAIFSGQLNGDYSNIPMALWLGFRLSMKTAGFIATLGFVLATIPVLIAQRYPSRAIRLSVHGLNIMLFALLFMARIPYYEIFNATFNQMVINGMHDDKWAIFITAVKEYQLWWRMPLGILVGLVLICIFEYILKLKVKKSSDCKHPIVISAFTLVGLMVFSIFVRYGGAFNYNHSINWENAGRLNSNLLNEAILDDGQALYRVRSMKKLQDKINDIQLSPEQLRKNIKEAGGNPHADSLHAAFLHKVEQPKLTKQPKQIVVLLGESFGDWPFQPQFAYLGLVNQTMAIKNATNAAHIGMALPHGSGTISAVNGLLTGVADNGMYINQMPQAMATPFETGIGYIMKQLGYKTVFWYGGYSGWQNIKNFVLSQDFDEFHCADQFNAVGNAWGVEDSILLQNVQEYMAKQGANDKVFHVVLTTSNHPPYVVDVKKLGFNGNGLRHQLPASIPNQDDAINELGHIWYADKTMGEFVSQVKQQGQDTLFVITGDHSERFSFAIEQPAKVVSTIPIIFYGEGVQQNMFSAQSMGTHMQLAGTLAEMVGPAGFTYSAIMPNMFANNPYVFNHRLMIEDNKIMVIDKEADNEQKNHIRAMRSLSAWRTLKGDELK